MDEHTGWLLDVYAHPQDGTVVWLLDEDGERRRLTHNFPIRFYASGPFARLRALWKHLQTEAEPPRLSRVQRRDLFAGPLDVLQAEVLQAGSLPPIFYRALKRFPDLTFYDVDIPLALRYAAAFGVFPLARCRVQVDEAGQIEHIRALDSPWEIDPDMPPLRILTLKPDTVPKHKPPRTLLVYAGKDQRRFSLDHPKLLLSRLNAVLERHDPDLIFASWGDPWLFPYLFELADTHHIPFNPNRDTSLAVDRRKENSYYTYGQVIYRAQQTFLFGRWHIDPANAMMFGEYELRGVLEQARVTGLPVQEVARKSPGSGITAMQMTTALRNGILVPHRKQQTEAFKSLDEFIETDWGGMVYQPLTGLHPHVASVDFFSMYPSIMEHYNISPETVGVPGSNPLFVPKTRAPVNQDRPGFVPEVVRPLLEKRWRIKQRMADMGKQDIRYKPLKAQSSALKWLLVVSFGYLGYKNARWGKIESHEAVTAYSRELLLQAKEVAEELGFTVLHMYVDGLYIRKDGASRVADFQPVLDGIVERTRLPVALDGVFRWIAFLPSRQDARMAVPNRFFGVFQDGGIKIRGIEIRRHDTPKFIGAAQTRLLEMLAEAPQVTDLPAVLPAAAGMLQTYIYELRQGKIPLDQMLISHTVSRELDEFKTLSPAARAGRQLEAAGKPVRPGQRIRFLYTRGKPGVYAWDLGKPPAVQQVDIPRYEVLFVRAAHTVLQIFGLNEDTVRDWLLHNAGYGAPPGGLPAWDATLPPLLGWGEEQRGLAK